MSNLKFAELLTELGVEPPTKVSPTTGKETLALAKTDEGFKALETHEDVRVQSLVTARLGNKSTLEETRTQRFIDIAKRGLLLYLFSIMPRTQGVGAVLTRSTYRIYRAVGLTEEVEEQYHCAQRIHDN